MGLRARGRSKGKDAWFNWSVSSRGINCSTSVKLGKNTTVNVGKKGPRVRVNLGDGVSWVPTKERRSTYDSNDNSDSGLGLGAWMFIFAGLAIILLLAIS